jgi:hypothetical protein
MLSHITTDLYESYVEEVLKPQLGSKQPGQDGDANEGPKDPQESSQKRIRQAVYDIRYRARRENVPIESAFGQYMSHSALSSTERMAVREKLGLAKGSGAVKEDFISEEPNIASKDKKYKVRVTDRLSGKSYVRYATREKINKLRSNPNISSVEMTQYGNPYEGEKSKGEYTSKTTSGKGLDPVGREDKKGDVDNDGIPASKDKNDQYILNRRSKVDTAIKKRNKIKVNENFSDWRSDILEIVDDDIKFQKKNEIKEKNVNNNIVINPDLKIEGIQILEFFQLSEQYVNNIIDLASQYFYSEGYDEENVRIIAEGMGHNKFVDFIFDIGNTFFLDEAAYQGELLTSTGKARKNPKVSAAKGASTPVANTRPSVEKKKPEEKKSSPGQLSINYDKKPSPPGQERIKQAVGNAVQSATSPQTRQAVGKAAGSAVKSAANTAARAALSAWKGHKAAMKRKGEGGTVAQQVGAGLGAAAGAFFKKGKEHLKNSYEFTDWLDYIVAEGCDISEWTINDLYKQYKLNEAVYGNINEKAESEQQQKLFGLALSVKRGQTPRSEASAEVLKIVDSMSEKKIRDFAKTKHTGIPKKVDEAISQIPGRETTPPSGTTAKQDDLQRIQLSNKKRMLDRQRKLELDILQKQKQGKLPMGHAMGEETKKLSALDIVKQQVIAKHGAASIMGTSEQKAAAAKRAKEAAKKPQPKPTKRYEDDVYSKDGLGGIRGYRSGD